MAGQVLRLFWMYLGNILLLLSAAVISKQPRWTHSWIDVAFWGVCGAMLLARTLDVLRFGGLTTDERPATGRHVVRYCIILLLVAGLLWTLAQLVQTA